VKVRMQNLVLKTLARVMTFPFATADLWRKAVLAIRMPGRDRRFVSGSGLY